MSGKILEGRVLWRALLVSYLGLLGFLSLNPWVRPESTPGALSPDKLEHALAYGILAVSIYFSLASHAGCYRNCSFCAWSTAVGSAVSVGVFIEIAQGLFTSSRSGSIGDAAANAAGAMFGCIIFLVGKSFIRQIKVRHGS